jgi:hypothetical protein
MARRVLFVIAGLVLAATEAQAWQIGEQEDLLSIEIHGFASQGFLYTTANDYLAHSTKSSFEFTEVGLNFTKNLTDKLRAGLQLFSHRLGPTGTFDVKADWFYLDYKWHDWLGFRAGRVKLPFGLYNDTSDIDSARVPILLPQSVYPVSNRDFLLAQTGGELYGYASLGAGGALDYRVYGGTIFIDVPTQPATPPQIGEITTPYIVGGRLIYETPLDGLRLGSSLQALRINLQLLFPAPIGAVNAYINPAILWAAFAEYNAHDLLLSVEYSRWYVTVDSSSAALFPKTSTVSERAYGMAAYRVTNWFHPSIYYSVLYPDETKRRGRENQQHDLAATLRFDINSFWLVKLEGHYMHGTAALTPALNNGKPLAALDEDWGLLMIKTTVSF